MKPIEKLNHPIFRNPGNINERACCQLQDKINELVDMLNGLLEWRIIINMDLADIEKKLPEEKDKPKVNRNKVTCPNCGGCKILFENRDLKRPYTCGWCNGTGKIIVESEIEEEKEK